MMFELWFRDLILITGMDENARHLNIWWDCAGPNDFHTVYARWLGLDR